MGREWVDGGWQRCFVNEGGWEREKKRERPEERARAIRGEFRVTCFSRLCAARCDASTGVFEPAEERAGPTSPLVLKVQRATGPYGRALVVEASEVQCAVLLGPRTPSSAAPAGVH